MRPGEGIVGRVIAEGSLINVSDVQADPRFLQRGPATGLRSLMVASVQSGTRALGAISVQSAAPRAFSSEDERLLATLGAQAALAIENARFFEIERRRAEEAETLQHVTQTLISRLDLFEMLAAVVEAIATMGNCQYVSVFLLERDRLVLHANRGYLRSAPGPYSLRLDDGLVGRVARTGIPTLIPDVMKQDEEYQAAIPRGAVQSAIGVPLIHAGGMLGVLLIESGADRVLDDRDLRWLTNVGRQLSVAIENTRLYADLEEALQQEKATRARLVQSEKLAAMGRLVASVAHELNNPLQAIQNALYLVGQVSQLGTQAREDLQVAMTEADRMAGLIGRLRESYRPTAAQEFRAEALDTVVKEVRKLIGTHLRHNNVTFEFDADAALPAVAGIHDQLKQVFLNLCLNAVEAMPGGGRLTIGMRYEAESGQVLVTVADTGIGIDPAALPNVFDPFYTTKEGGTGLGLAITYDIIQRHNGRVEVESKAGPEGGTVFKVWLPVGQMTSSG
jgi:signal transduction histidine kinase